MKSDPRRRFVPLDLAGMCVSERLGRLRGRFGEAGIDALLVTNLTNVSYLTGFTGTAGMVLVGPDSATLLTDGRYRTQSAEQLEVAGVVADIEVGRPSQQRESLARLARDFSRLGLEAEHVTWAMQRTLAKVLAGEDVDAADSGGPSAEPTRAEPIPGRPEPIRAEPIRAEPIPGRPEPIRPEPIRAEPIRAEPIRAEPGSAEPGSAEPGPGPELVATSGLVAALRRVKDPGELARMQAAAAVADAALADVLGLLVAGVTELELAAALDHQMRLLGAQDRSFETIVASGPNAAKPHARPTDRPIGVGELVVVDFGAIIEGYCSDMTRTFCIGPPRSSVLAAVVEVVAAAQAAGVAAVAPGVEAVAVDRACRDVVASAGWSEAFMHGTGHGVGLEIHEPPSVGATSTDKLEESSVVTVEPGVYLPGVGGARIEDTVVVTAGGARALTCAPKVVVLG
ncbi:MAG: M24 family metallopeptidase [Acidimicrobiales bacterium]